MSINVPQLDRNSAITLQDQICEWLSKQISQGFLAPGMRLPSCRKLSAQLSVSRNTVVQAYQNLIFDGLVESRQKSGYFVPAFKRSNPLLNMEVEPGPPIEAVVDLLDVLPPVFTPSSYKVIQRPKNWGSYPYPFVCNQMNADRFPLNEWRKCTDYALSRGLAMQTTSDYLYEDCAELVEQVRTRLLPQRGIFVSADEILITVGAQQALYLVSSILGSKSRNIAVENPCYPDARNIFHHFFDKVVPVNTDEQGIVCDDRLDDCSMVYVTPNHQYPTTVRLTSKRRSELLEKAAKQQIVVLEDDYDSETDFDPLSPPALRADPKGAHVIYVGSMSKSINPGLRIGYMVGPASLIKETRALRGMMVRHLPPVLQLAAAKFIQLGHYDALMARLHQIYQRRWHIAKAALSEYFPDTDMFGGWGGTNFFLSFDPSVNLKGFEDVALEAGVVIDPVRVCYENETHGVNRMRLGVSAVRADKIEPGIALLSKTLGSFLTK